MSYQLGCVTEVMSLKCSVYTALTVAELGRCLSRLMLPIYHRGHVGFNSPTAHVFVGVSERNGGRQGRFSKTFNHCCVVGKLNGCVCHGH